MLQIELLGYQLIKIDKEHYDATVVARHENLADIVQGCIESDLDIVSYLDGKLIVRKL